MGRLDADPKRPLALPDRKERAMRKLLLLPAILLTITTDVMIRDKAGHLALC